MSLERKVEEKKRERKKEGKNGPKKCHDMTERKELQHLPEIYIRFVQKARITKSH